MPLSETQSILLSAASQRDDLLVPLPDTLKGGAARKVADGLLNRGLAEEIIVSRSSPFWREEDGEPVGLRITPEGLAAIGLAESEEEASSEGIAGEPPAPPVSVPATRQPVAGKPPRAGSKQSQLIALLSREEGASIGEIATALGWLPHTTRAALTGLRHKGYELARVVHGDRGSLYRITAMPIMEPAIPNAVQAEAA